MKIALYLRHIDHASQPVFGELVEALHAKGIAVQSVTDGDSVDGCDFLFSIGGDGTLLSSVQFVRSSNPAAFPPILGINFGHLGFLTTVGKEDFGAMIDDLLAGHYSLEQRTLLQINDDAYALNEVFLHRSEESSLLRTNCTELSRVPSPPMEKRKSQPSTESPSVTDCTAMPLA